MENTINCSHKENKTWMKDSMEVYEFGSPGFWIICCIGAIGIVNNCLILIAFYRLKWFREKKMILFWNLAIIDLLVCSAAIVVFSTFISKVLMHKSDIQKQKTCVQTLIVLYALCSTSSTFALAIAIDRLLSKWFPYQWSKYEKRFRWTAVIASWTWAIGHEAVFYSTTPTDTCVFVCISSSSYPQNWWATVSACVNNTISGLIVLIYIVLPCITSLRISSCFRQLGTAGMILNFDKLQRQQHEFVVRIRLMSAIYIACYLISTVPAFVICDVIILYYNQNNFLTIIFSLICNVCLILNSFLPFYIWLFDAAFRHEVSSIFKGIFNFFCKY